MTVNIQLIDNALGAGETPFTGSTKINENFEALNNGKVNLQDGNDISGTQNIEGSLNVTGNGFPVMSVTRETTLGDSGDFENVTGVASGLELLTRTSVLSVDGFGGGFVWRGVDIDGQISTLGRGYARRDGSRNMGAVQFFAGLDGSSPAMIIRSNLDTGFGTVNPKAKLDVSGGIKVGNDSDTASSDKAGTTRYRVDGNTSYYEICMQTGASTYSWEVIKTFTW